MGQGLHRLLQHPHHDRPAGAGPERGADVRDRAPRAGAGSCGAGLGRPLRADRGRRGDPPRPSLPQRLPLGDRGLNSTLWPPTSALLAG
ncbi:hypothetical protein ACFFX0_13745 [Citricoccus parietis]|uniref:Uncharacterized protein n=1 Tax=Citricoccus parietis TaxID=592307 RepID=A0ABV5G125_9MICC